MRCNNLTDWFFGLGLFFPNAVVNKGPFFNTENTWGGLSWFIKFMK